MIFYYNGVQRLSLFFGTPNRCAVVLGILLLLLSGVFASAWPNTYHRSPGRLAWISALGAGIIVLVLAIALTYSRGGYLATAAGLVVMLLLLRDRKWIVAAILVLGVGIVFVIPHGSTRVSSILDVESDLSIRNRLILWRGTLAMLWDWAPGTVELYNLRQFYPAWYQPAEMPQRYLTPVNDYLTVALASGFWGLAFYLVSVSATVIFGARTTWRSRSPALAGAVGATCVYLAAGLTSTFIVQPPVVTAFVMALCCLGIGCIMHHTTWSRPAIARCGFAAFGIGASGCVILVFASWYAANRIAYLPARLFVRQAGLAQVETQPRHGAARAKAYVIVENWDWVRQVRSFVRPLVDSGYDVTLIKPTDFGAPGIDQLTAFFESPLHRSGHVIAFGDAGRVLLLPAVLEKAKPRTAVLVGLAATSPLPAYSPLRNIAKVDFPVLIAHARHDQKVDSDNARLLFEKCQAGQQVARLYIFEGDRVNFLDSSPELPKTILAFLAEQTAP